MTCSYLICHLLFSCHYELSGFHTNQFSMFTKQMALLKKKIKQSKKMTLNDKKRKKLKGYIHFPVYLNKIKNRYEEKKYISNQSEIGFKTQWTCKATINDSCLQKRKSYDEDKFFQFFYQKHLNLF